MIKEEKKETYLIIGGAGFIGSNMADFLIQKEYKVKVIDNLSTGNLSNLNPTVEFYNLDASEDNLEFLIKDVDYIIHLAASPNVQQSLDFPKQTNKNNLLTTINILEAVRKNKNIKKFVFSSTSAIYGNTKTFPTNESSDYQPLSPYGLQKLCSEEYIKLYSHLYNISSVCLRYFNVYGNRMTTEGAYKTVISVFLENYKKNKPLTITNNGEQRRDFIHVNDVVMANYLASKKQDELYDVFNVGFGKNFSINEISKLFNSENVYVGNRVEPLITLCDNSKIKEKLGWKPTIDLKDWLKSEIDKI